MASTKRMYERFRAISLEISHLNTSYALADWDQVNGMPAAAEEMRTEVLSTLARLVHVRSTSREYGALIRKLVKAADKGKLGRERAIIVRDHLVDLVRNRKLPASFVEAQAKLSAESIAAWHRAKEDSDWKAFRPKLKALVRMAREKAALTGYEKNPYESALDDFDPSLTVEELDTLFVAVKAATLDLLGRIRGSSHGPTTESRKRFRRFDIWPVAQQRKLNRQVVEALGFDFDAGRYDVDVEGYHPFTIEIQKGDVRFTTKLDRKFTHNSLLTTVHETGHGLYAQGLPYRHYGTTGCMSPTFGLDESQSRLYENHVGRSLPFNQWLFGERNGRLVYRHANEVRPSLIRIDADEVTYKLHIILRYEIERALLEGTLDVNDAPDAWQEKTREYFGIEVPDHERGILQDGHWAWGDFGYFPSYVLGDLYAAQLFASARRAIRCLDRRMRRGQFDPLREWLVRNVHRHGGLYTPEDIIKKATGEKPDAKYLIAHLEARYGELYKL